MLILPCLQIFLLSFNYLTAAFLLIFVFSLLFKIMGVFK